MAGRVPARRKTWRMRGAIAAAAITAIVAAMAWLIDGSLAASRPKPAGSLAGRSGQARLTESSSGIPSGWEPVPYRRARLSVPGRWLVETPRTSSARPALPG